MKAAGKLADRSPEVNAVLEHHENLAETTRLVFTVLTAVFAALVLAPMALKREPGELATIGLAVLFLAVYGAGTLVLANTAHNGGRLVHELGVRALMPSAPLPARSSTAPRCRISAAITPTPTWSTPSISTISP